MDNELEYYEWYWGGLDAHIKEKGSVKEGSFEEKRSEA